MLSIRAAQQKYSRQIPLDEVAILLADTLGKDQTFLHMYPEKKLSLKEWLILHFRVWLRKRGFSIAVVLGHKEFYGLDFFVSVHTLIPRPETELLVEEALKAITPDTVLIDVGTGTGCIPIAITKHKPATTYAGDISYKALEIAQKNAQRHNIAITFFQGNLLGTIPLDNAKPLVITANLPYLTNKQFEEEPSIQREPYSALVAEKNGLALYEELLLQLKGKNCIQPVTLFFEIDPAQRDEIREIITRIFPDASVEIKNDLAGQDRLVITRLNS